MLQCLAVVATASTQAFTSALALWLHRRWVAGLSIVESYSTTTCRCISIMKCMFGDIYCKEKYMLYMLYQLETNTTFYIILWHDLSICHNMRLLHILYPYTGVHPCRNSMAIRTVIFKPRWAFSGLLRLLWGHPSATTHISLRAERCMTNQIFHSYSQFTLVRHNMFKTEWVYLHYDILRLTFSLHTFKQKDRGW